VEKQIKMAGWQSSAEVRRRIADSCAMVLPSFAEGIPVVLMEALALERPVIATQIAGIPELVEPGRSGWLVPAGSVDDLVEAMRAAVKTPAEELARLGKHGRARVLERHNLVTEVAKLAAMFERVLGQARA
jgi:colanic acid/amylovoran biosynthesis glycosyltransferase